MRKDVIHPFKNSVFPNSDPLVGNRLIADNMMGNDFLVLAFKLRQKYSYIMLSGLNLCLRCHRHSWLCKVLNH